MELNDFFEEKDHNSKSKRRNRTINVSEDLHSFYKKLSSHYDVGMSTIISNVLSNWRDEYKDEIKVDIVKKLKKNDF